MMTPNRIFMAAALVLGGGLLLASTGANACGNGKVIFEDKFATLDSSWGVATENRLVENGALVLKNKDKTGFTWAVSQSDFYGDVAVCVDVTVAKLSDKEKGFTGIVFWHQDDSNYYQFGYWPETSVGIRVDRLSKNKWLYPMQYTQTPAVKAGVGQTNTLEVDTKGNKVTLYVNDTKVGEFNGRAPEGGGRVGLFTYNSDGETVTKFTNFVIAEPRSGQVSMR